MKRTKYTHRYIARIVLEAVAPLAVGSGEKDFISDRLVATDVNGLPYIPATSVAGVLRHAMDKEIAVLLFGNPDAKQMTGSSLIFSDAVLIGKEGKALDGVQPDLDSEDAFYTLYFNLPVRQHACITNTGVVKDGGKFDEQVVYKGTRFCFEMEMVSDGSNYEAFESVLRKLKKPNFRLGGSIRLGFGEMKVQSCRVRQVNLGNPEDVAFYARKSASLSIDWEGTEVDFPEGQLEEHLNYTLLLYPEDFYLFGAGFGDDDADMTAVEERMVEWEAGLPHFTTECKLVPATSVKGAVSHRTAYHWNRLAKHFADGDGGKVENRAVRELFGFIEDGGLTHPGCVYISDVYVRNYTMEKVIPHVAIDRFTGGTLNGALFSEKVVYGGNVELKIVVAPRGRVISPDSYSALELALKDLCCGLLPLGGGVNRGYGTFKGQLYKNGEVIYGKQVD